MQAQYVAHIVVHAVVVETPDGFKYPSSRVSDIQNYAELLISESLLYFCIRTVSDRSFFVTYCHLFSVAQDARCRLSLSPGTTGALILRGFREFYKGSIPKKCTNDWNRVSVHTKTKSMMTSAAPLQYCYW